jgi:hypothetical protein
LGGLGERGTRIVAPGGGGGGREFIKLRSGEQGNLGRGAALAKSK